MTILVFPHLPTHKPLGTILNRNLADASEHLDIANTQYDVLTETGLRWREEAICRYNRANMAMMWHRLSTLDEAV